MLDWLTSFGDALIQIFDFIISFFKNVIEICILVFKGFAYATQVVAFLPIQYQAIVLAIVSYALIKTIIHFGG